MQRKQTGTVPACAPGYLSPPAPLFLSMPTLNHTPDTLSIVSTTLNSTSPSTVPNHQSQPATATRPRTPGRNHPSYRHQRHNRHNHHKPTSYTTQTNGDSPCMRTRIPVARATPFLTVASSQPHTGCTTNLLSHSAYRAHFNFSDTPVPTLG
ncbi:MAG: hypothetical protein RLZZ436_4278 [Planctomycetota bacterium]